MGAGPSIIYGGTYYNQPTTAASTSVVLAQGIGVLKNIIISQAPASTGTITVYDNNAANTTSNPNAAIMAVITVGTSQTPVSLEFNATYGTGLTFVTGTATGNYTFVYQ